MSSSNSPTSQTSNSYVEQTVSVLSSVASYMRLPALASTMSPSLPTLASQISKNFTSRPTMARSSQPSTSVALAATRTQTSPS
ncbi:hypothetical protein LB505_010319 [Fusarium chuoi]|nr:hypothetical protein LB505_010319 [Fusarium chuoi]